MSTKEENAIEDNMKSYEFIWKEIREKLESKVTTLFYETFVKSIVPQSIKGDAIYLAVPTKTVVETFEKDKYAKILKSAVEECNTDVKRYVFTVNGEALDDESEDEIDLYSPINPHYTFENFVVGDSNRHLWAAAKAVAQNPGENFNPLYIYGGTGLGKTHIMHAIANYIKQETPNANVLYATCEKFTTDLIAGIKSGKVYRDGGSDFRNKYRKVDVLIIDDIQFLAGKQSTQEEFFHTFNELFGQNKQIIVSSDCLPSEIATLTERLRTRFEGGLMAQVTAPDIETKIAILQKKGEEKQAIISYEVATFIAENSNNNIRSLEGLLNKVIFASLLHEKPITLELAKNAIKQSSGSDAQEAITADDVVETTCKYFNIAKADLIGKKKNREFAEPRMISAYLMTDMLTIPLVAIGKVLGGRDYTTIIHSRDKIAEMMETHPRINTAVTDIKNLLLKK